MRGTVLGQAGEFGRFEVQPDRAPDGSLALPRTLTISYRPCWRKPPIRLTLVFAYTDPVEKVAYYAVAKGNG